MYSRIKREFTPFQRDFLFPLAPLAWFYRYTDLHTLIERGCVSLPSGSGGRSPRFVEKKEAKRESCNCNVNVHAL